MLYLVHKGLMAGVILALMAVCLAFLGCNKDDDDTTVVEDDDTTTSAPGDYDTTPETPGTPDTTSTITPPMPDPQKAQYFLQAMVPHHEGAVKAAEMAATKAQNAKLKDLAQQMVTQQNAESAQMRQLHQRLYAAELTPNEAASASLGMSATEMTPLDMAALETADPFDKAFIDAMIKHHQAAIRMARMARGSYTDAEFDKLLSDIIDKQSAEINQMNEIYRELYGSESPSGGVPPEDGTAPMGGANSPPENPGTPPTSM